MNFFGLFGKKERKKDGSPTYDPKLIPQFLRDHKELVKQVEAINEAIEKGASETKIKQMLKLLKTKLLGHFMTEDLKLYRFLRTRYKNDRDVLATIGSFESSIKEIQREVLQFFDHYTIEGVALDREFVKKFSEIADALATRIDAEESSLYTLYHT